MDEQKDLNGSESELFNGDTISPQFALALRSFFQKNLKIKGGSTTQSGGVGTGALTFAHNLGVVPQVYGLTSQVWTAGPPGTVTAVNSFYFDPANPPDKTNFYLLNPNGNNATISFAWFVMGF